LNLILGGKASAGAGQLDVLNPYDGSLVDRVAAADQSQVAQAVASAARSQSKVAGLTRAERSSILAKVSDGLRASADELALLLAREVGKTLREARLEVERAATTFSWAGEEAKRIGGEVLPFDAVSAGAARRGFAFRVPAGPVAAITPFNFPLNLAAHKVGPAIAAGNAFVLKPASKTPLADLVLGRLVLEAGFPPEAVSVLPGAGETVGMALARDPRLRAVTFTGSARVGKRIVAETGLKRTTMELGSDSAVVVARSANLEAAAGRIVRGAFALAGQVCISVQRVLAEEPVFEELVALVADEASRLKVGDQLDEATDMGPVISEGAAKRLDVWIAEAAGAGAEIRLGGTRKGTLYDPTVLTGVPADAKIWCEEAFGPVVCINAYGGFSEALDAVNASRFGLQAGVFTDSVEQAFEAIDRLEVGGVIINDVPAFRLDHMPYGGVKDSGLGREGVRYAIEEMTEIKLVCFNLGHS
jgi:glyceraldehyde-3-phosphate dehydrogenase (NADP+)